MKQFNKILIANRGEIAVRIIKSAQKLGIQTVAIYSTVDENALYCRMADETYLLSGTGLSETYLNTGRIIEIALQSGAEAIHPGYGFLSENAAFVQACENAGIVFIGPNSKSIQLMGNKIEARRFIKSINVPLTEGITGTPNELLASGSALDFPILVKAAAGGGGKGMRIVRKASELQLAVESTSREALSYFGNGDVYIEKFIENPRHIEIQIIGDNFGSVVHLFERECSIQRRYQKIIEESPSPTLTPEVRRKMGEAAVRIGEAIGYNNAGTIEFLVDTGLNFYFLEMNTRVQVEHPVTEMVTGIDIVEEQIRIAAGNPLSIEQSQVKQRGHAIECRIYAENPANDFMPSPGTMRLYHEPEGHNIRIDSGIDSATTIHSFFDPMISKLIVWGNHRDEARRKTLNALQHFAVQGIETNITFLKAMLQNRNYIENSISTVFCDKHVSEIIQQIENERSEIDLLYPAAAFLLHDLNQNRLQEQSKLSVWEQSGFWRHLPSVPVEIDDNLLTFEIEKASFPHFRLRYGDSLYNIEVKQLNNNSIQLLFEKKYFTAYISPCYNREGFVSVWAHNFRLRRTDTLCSGLHFDASEMAGTEGGITAPMPGKVIKIQVNEGDKVAKGDVLLIVEAMKMENNILSNTAGTVRKINVATGDMVETSTTLVEIDNEN